MEGTSKAAFANNGKFILIYLLSVIYDFRNYKYNI